MAALGGDSKRKLIPLTPSIYYISLKKTRWTVSKRKNRAVLTSPIQSLSIFPYIKTIIVSEAICMPGY